MINLNKRTQDTALSSSMSILLRRIKALNNTFVDYTRFPHQFNASLQISGIFFWNKNITYETQTKKEC